MFLKIFIQTILFLQIHGFTSIVSFAWTDIVTLCPPTNSSFKVHLRHQLHKETSPVYNGPVWTVYSSFIQS